MILLFPTDRHFQKALRANLLPEALLTAPLKAQLADGAIRIEVLKKDFTKDALAKLDALGTVFEAKFPEGDTRTYPHALMLGQVEPDPSPVVYETNTPVLFEVDPAQDAKLTPELLRLGNDRIAFYPKLTSAGTLVLRVFGPPYYSFLRTFDSHAGVCRAFTEAAPRFWVQAGFRFPLADLVQVPPNQFILARPGHDWETLPEEQLVDVYERVKFELPRPPVEAKRETLKGKIRVPLMLSRAGDAEPARLWVFRGADARERFERWVEEEEEPRLARFSYAVANLENEPVYVLQARPTRDDLPVVPSAGAEEYRPFWKLPNLYLPVGRRLHPMLRRDRVRELLLPNGEAVVWLRASGEKEFLPESLPENAFQPLEQWVEYVIEREREPLTAWMKSFRFDFDNFRMPGEAAPTPPPEKPKEDERERKPTRAGKAKEQAGKPVLFDAPKESTVTVTCTEAPNALKLERSEREKEFLAIVGPNEDPRRLELWPCIALLNAKLGEVGEAALAWSAGAWPSGDVPREWLDAWQAVEEPLKGLPDNPSVAAVRAVALHALRGDVTAEELPKLLAWLDEQDRQLPVRLMWLAWSSLFQRFGLDALRLARVRDRLFERLRLGGLHVERDLPLFLRYVEKRDGERLRDVRQQLEKLHLVARKWHGSLEELNGPYVDLVFAFGLARIGQDASAKDLLQQAGRALIGRQLGGTIPQQDHVAPYLLKAFAHRIQQALDHQSTRGLFPDSFAAELDAVNKKTAKGPFSTEKYVIERTFEESWILSPLGWADPYRMSRTHKDPIRTELEKLGEVRDPEQLKLKLRRLLDESAKAKTPYVHRLLVLGDGLPHAPRAGEAFAVEWLTLTTDLLAGKPATVSEPEMQQLAKEREITAFGEAIFLAGHFNREDLARRLFEAMIAALQRRPKAEQPKVAGLLTREALSPLRKLGLRGEVARFLEGVRNVVLDKESMAVAKARHGKEWPTALATLLCAAEGWLAMDQERDAEPVLEEARAYLFTATGNVNADAMKYAAVAEAYLAAVGQARPGETTRRVVELYERLVPLKYQFTTDRWYARLHLRIVHQTVRSLVGEDGAVSPEARRWLDDDEYLVRKRVHADVKRLLS